MLCVYSANCWSVFVYVSCSWSKRICSVQIVVGQYLSFDRQLYLKTSLSPSLMKIILENISHSPSWLRCVWCCESKTKRTNQTETKVNMSIKSTDCFLSLQSVKWHEASVLYDKYDDHWSLVKILPLKMFITTNTFVHNNLSSSSSLNQFISCTELLSLYDRLHKAWM